MPNTIGSKFGDVVLVPFPFTDQTASKKRPAVVVSSDAYHRDRPDVIVVAITSRLAQAAASVGDVLLEDWRGAGLLKASLIKPVFTTVEQRLILRKLGVLQEKDVLALRTALHRVLG
jgi:mRNA interferase MazF